MPPNRKYGEMLRQDIDEARFNPGAPLPSFRELAGRYSCSVATVKRMVDTLQDEGLLVTVAGKGTFFASASPVPRRPQNNIIGVVTVHNRWQECFAQYRGEWLAKGWLFAIYDAFFDRQAPNQEREFLLRAQAEGFRSVVMVPSPFAADNTALFKRLRLEGIKIAHLTPDLADLEHETFFLLDHAAAGREAVRQARARGYRHAAFVDISLPSAFKRLMLKGAIEEAAPSGVRILPAINVGYWDDDTPAGETPERHAFKVARTGEYIDLFHSLPERTALLCTQSDLADSLKTMFLAHGMTPGDRLGIVALDDNSPGPRPVSGMRFDVPAQIRAALEYASDNSIGPTVPVQRWFAPVFEDLNTL